MARIIMADNGIAFDGRTPEQGPLGGAESAFVCMAEALASRGHSVQAFSNCEERVHHNGVNWEPLKTAQPGIADLYIANRSPQLLQLVSQVRRTVFWLHNRAQYLGKLKNLPVMWKIRPAMIFSGAYHQSTCPWWVPTGKQVIVPYGIDDRFRNAEPATAPPGPRAIFTSNPQRSLDWLLEIWEKRIRPAVPGAELQIYSGTTTYGAFGDKMAARIKPVLDRAASLNHAGVVLHDPVPKDRLVEELRRTRALLYRGDRGETFCLALGESQAMGVPAVVRPIGSVAERIIDGETGVVAATDEAFADAAISLLTDDALWRRQHTAALSRQRGWGWADAAAEYEKLMP
jgi:glycosyltransferase involved in cell wall biosynthesis